MPETEGILDESVSYIIDAIDTVTAKIELVLRANKLNVPIVSSMGTGNKLDPTRFEITDIYKTSVCPLAKVMRKELKDRGIKKLKVIYSKEEPVEVRYERDGQEYTTLLTPKYDEESGRYLYGFISTSERVRTGVFDTIKYSFYDVAYYIDVTIQSVKMLFSGGVTVNDLNGPVGIVQNMGQVYEESVENDGYYYAFLNMLNWTILLSANLGVMNLLPLPALDGGRLVFLIIEAVRGKAIDQEKEGMIHTVGILLLLALMVVVLFNDNTIAEFYLRKK